MKEDWVECTLGRVFKIVSGSTPKGLKEVSADGEIPFYKVSDMNHKGNEVFMKKSNIYLSESDFENLKLKLYPKGTVIFPKRGGAILTNKKRVLFQNSCFDLNLMGVLPNEFVEDKYLFFWFQKLDLCSIYDGSNVPQINNKNIFPLSFPLSPLIEQQAIVKKIEELFSSLESGIADLKKAQDQLKIYRQAVLKKAFEGELTKEWREKQTELPTAEELLMEIKKERQKHYEQQLAKWKEAIIAWENNGKEGKKPGKPGKIKEFELNEIEELPIIPNSWAWEKLGNVCLKIMDGTHFSPKNIEKGDFKYITAKNIKEGRIDLRNISYVTQEDHEAIFDRCDVKKGDVLYIKDGATTGRAAVNTLEEEFSLLSSVGVFRTIKSFINPKFLESFLNAQVTRNRMLSNIAGVAITRLTLVKLNNSMFSLCSVEEQHQIVQEIESRLSVCDAVEQNIQDSLEKAQALRQSILKKAFEGTLLSDKEIAKCKAHPDYEPASVLLERIKKG
tara:strand:+ start:2276 stop:3784 length:1509 start_codon:yes stop_codon:yes gene_type:complete